MITLFVGKDFEDPSRMLNLPSVPDDIDVSLMLTHTADVDARIDFVKSQYVAELQRAFVAALEADPEVERGTTEVQRKPGDIWRIRVEHDGWHALYRLTEEKSPELARLNREVKKLKQERFNIITKNASFMRLGASEGR